QTQAMNRVTTRMMISRSGADQSLTIAIANRTATRKPSLTALNRSRPNQLASGLGALLAARIRSRHRHRADQVAHDLPAIGPAHARRRVHDDPVRECRLGQVLDVVWRHERPPTDRGPCP